MAKAIGIIGGVTTYLAVHLRGRAIPIDDTLDVWAVFQGKYGWDASGSAELWMYFNLLVRSP